MKAHLILALAGTGAVFYYLYSQQSKPVGEPQSRNGDRAGNRSSDFNTSNYAHFNHSWNGNDVTKIGRNTKGITYWLNGKKVFAPYGANGKPDYSRITPIRQVV